MNRVQLIGNLGHTPESRFSDRGVLVVNFRMATHERWVNKSGEEQERTEWHRVVVWGNLAARCKELQKGNRVYVEGKLRTRKWTDRSGSERYTTEIVASHVEAIVRPERNGQNNHTPDETPVPENGQDDVADGDIAF
jgi:single-strand DNA-binding protein